MPQSKDIFWLIQAPYISKHISRNGGATIKASKFGTRPAGPTLLPFHRLTLLVQKKCVLFEESEKVYA